MTLGRVRHTREQLFSSESLIFEFRTIPSTDYCGLKGVQGFTFSVSREANIRQNEFHLNGRGSVYECLAC